ncbi:reverse transcriptase domain-containing protein [Tanacetum coccineum]
MTILLEKDSVFNFDEECNKAFETLKEKLKNAPIMALPNWSLPFELMCDASDFTVGGAENVATDHLSRLEKPNLKELKDEEINDEFPDEFLMSIKTDEEESPWFADFSNYLVGGILRRRLTYAQRCKFFSELKHYFWDKPYLIKACPDGMIRRCVHGSETRKTLDECHHGPTGRHNGPSITAKKVFDAGLYWPTIFKEAQTLNDYFNPHGAQDEALSLKLELKQVKFKFRGGLILLLQEFDIEIKNKIGAENVAADHLSRLEKPNLKELKDEEINDVFPDEFLISIKTDKKESQWFADFVNYPVEGNLRKGLIYAQRCKFFLELKHYFWDEPYLFKACPDGMIRRCVHGSKTQKILDECHHGSTGGHYGPSITAKKVFDAGFYWPTIYKEAQTLV